MNNNILSQRIEKCARGIIGKLELDLQGLTVYTEIGSGNYAWTSIIAGLANADRVYAYTKASKYGTAEEIARYLDDVTTTLGMDEVRSRIRIVPERIGKHVSEADIITNSGFIRPIDEQMIDMMKRTAVVPLMYETWEFRREDIAIEACIRKGIPVLGTKEEVWPLDMMRYGGFLTSKLLFECGLEVHKDRILVIGKGRLASNITRFLDLNGIENSNIRNLQADPLDLGEWDAIVVAEFDDDSMTIGHGGVIDPEKISKENPIIQIVHICGNIDESLIRKLGLQLYPDHLRRGYMTVTADYLGPKATIELNAAGLKVGEIMARYRLVHDYEQTIELSTKHSIVDGWSK
jgi:hypothetical protein